MKKTVALFTFVLNLSLLHAEEISSCVFEIDKTFEEATEKALDNHTVKLSLLSLEKESLLKNSFSLFSLKQSLSKMKDIREKYKAEEKKEGERFKEELEALKNKHSGSLLRCDELSKEVSNTRE